MNGLSPRDLYVFDDKITIRQSLRCPGGVITYQNEHRISGSTAQSMTHQFSRFSGRLTQHEGPFVCDTLHQSAQTNDVMFK